MSRPLSLATPTALEYFATLVAEDEGLPVLEAAVACAQDWIAQLDVQRVLAEVDGLTARWVQRLPADAAPMQRLRSLNAYFFEELGFSGNVNDYYDPANSLLPEVLRTRRGIPITLALLYIELARGAGLDACGIGFPGHYLVKVRLHAGDVVIDPFSGRSLDREALEERLQPFREARGLVGDDELPLGLFLQPATGRETVARLLRNLREIHRSAGDWAQWVAVQRRLVVLLPDTPAERRDLAMALAASGAHSDASAELERYLALHPEADDGAALRQRLSAWRTAH